ncbi:Exodeoxyribonuclease VII small subunit [Humidesulfovibrio mexicanus]|uniref:Exodeoxyribonuclease 7 small subunit n=1 Tax=Humidesulfovibrio mexicanus TaxID=147047 RepID=A0A239AS21_9BACT|nr:exodeoxyribonuclease VII small subunit [Humidesulfovibrio mexicanus]SNR97854.1 Exodeoxyribonuclease VII small subunit [Humidesulfovibrio mexicanus]
MAKDTRSFEERLERLKAVVESLEGGEPSLEEALRLYKEGIQLSGRLGRDLEAAKNEVRLAQDGLLKEFDALDAAAEAGE